MALKLSSSSCLRLKSRTKNQIGHLVYPQLGNRKKGTGKKAPTAQLDDMLAKAKIDDNLISKLGEGMKHLGEQASKMGEVADASVATKGYSDALGESVKPRG